MVHCQYTITPQEWSFNIDEQTVKSGCGTNEPFHFLMPDKISDTDGDLGQFTPDQAVFVINGPYIRKLLLTRHGALTPLCHSCT